MTSAQIYAHLEAVVLPLLKLFPEDLTKTDRAVLAEYTGPFLLSYRTTGTHLALLGDLARVLKADSPHPAEVQVQREFARVRAQAAWDSQKYFLHFDGEAFYELTQKQAVQVLDDHEARLLSSLPARPRVATPAADASVFSPVHPQNLPR